MLFPLNLFFMSTCFHHLQPLPCACTAVTGGWWDTCSATALYSYPFTLLRSNSKVSPSNGLKGLPVRLVFLYAAIENMAMYSSLSSGSWQDAACVSRNAGSRSSHTLCTADIGSLSTMGILILLKSFPMLSFRNFHTLSFLSDLSAGSSVRKVGGSFAICSIRLTVGALARLFSDVLLLLICASTASKNSSSLSDSSGDSSPRAPGLSLLPYLDMRKPSFSSLCICWPISTTVWLSVPDASLSPLISSFSLWLSMFTSLEYSANASISDPTNLCNCASLLSFTAFCSCSAACTHLECDSAQKRDPSFSGWSRTADRFDMDLLMLVAVDGGVSIAGTPATFGEGTGAEETERDRVCLGDRLADRSGESSFPALGLGNRLWDEGEGQTLWRADIHRSLSPSLGTFMNSRRLPRMPLGILNIICVFVFGTTEKMLGRMENRTK
eukprot:comp23550_c0_seq2/m.39765 comp23550_c0_seq2/g.39765  ORF comp23550_c0_seq2/g.39765 comp23550_c0_seq2/m.39765 type:complete len:440 (+) comp23550_c0_seq2:923-2242(+)